MTTALATDLRRTHHAKPLERRALEARSGELSPATPKPAAPTPAHAAAVADEAAAVNDARGAAGQALLDTTPGRAGAPPLPATEAQRAAQAAEALYARAAADATALAETTTQLSEAQKFDHYADLVEANGGRLKTGAHERNLVAIRVPTDADSNGGNGLYDDRMAMFWQDEQGQKHVREYTGNTEPNASYRGKLGDDANGDGTLDQGRLPSGQTFDYQFKSAGKFQPTTAVDAERDTNGDGLFGNDGGATSSEQRTMLFHRGSEQATDSAGCQTMPPADYQRFLKDLQGRQGAIGYTIIDAHLAAPVTTEC